MTTTEREPYPFVTKVIDLFRDWLKQRRELNELTEYAADPGELERVARELNVTPADLETLVRQGSQSANELSYTLTALGIDETALWRAEPAFARHGARLFVLYAQAPVSSGARGRHCRDELCGVLRKRGYNGRVEVQELKITHGSTCGEFRHEVQHRCRNSTPANGLG